MAAASKALWGVVRWRWTPFFGLVGGSLLYVLLAILIVPTKIDAASARQKGEELVIVGDEPTTPNALTTTQPRPGSAARGFAPRNPIAAPPPPAAVDPFPPTPGLRPGPPPPPVRELDPRPAPQPEPPPAAPPPPAQQEEEEEEEEEQGAVEPRRIPPRTLAGALRVLPPAGRTPVAPEPEPEPDEPDEDE